MVRKITSIVTLIVVAFALLPAVAAYAADGSADVDAQYRDIFPSDGAPAALSITVNNTGTAPSLMNLNQGGDPITNVIFDLPLHVDNVACEDFGEWTCRADNRAGGQDSLYWTTDGGGIDGGASLQFPFSGVVLDPYAVERVTTTDVLVAGDDRDFTYVEGNLDITIHGLELFQGVTITESRANAENILRYTSGQDITAAFDVHNRTGVEATINPSFNSNSFTGTLQSGNQTLAAGAPTETYTFNVDTSGVNSGEIVEDFDGRANGTANGQTGDAVTINGTTVQNFTRQPGVDIEAPAGLSLGGRDSVQVDGENDLSVPSRNGTSISIGGTKANYPAVDLTAGIVPSDLVLSIPGCSDPNPGDPNDGVTCSITASLDDVTGNNGAPSHGVKLPRTNSLSTNLRFHYNNVNLADLNPNFTGDLVGVDATFTYAGRDDNDFEFPQFSITLEDLLTIDLAAPILKLDTPVGNLLDDRVADGDTATVEGYVAHAGDLETMSATLRSTQPASSADQLPEDRRQEIPEGSGFYYYSEVVATEADLGGETDCSGTEYEGTGLVCEFFSVNVDLPGEKNADNEETYAIGMLGDLVVSGTATDDAGNSAPGTPVMQEVAGVLTPVPQNVAVDNDHADITPTAPFLNPDTGETETEALAFYVEDDAYNGKAVRVAWDPGSFSSDIVEGGCSPERWSVADGDVDVEEVLFYDGSTCDGGGADPNADAPAYTNVNDRILILDAEINPSADVVNFSYIAEPGLLSLNPGAPLTDAIANEAYAQSGRILDLLTPQIPLLGNITRLDTFDGGRETVGESIDDLGDEDDANDITIYHSNIADLEIPVTQFEPGADVLQVYNVLADGSLDPIGDPISTDGLDDTTPLTLTHEDIAFTDTAQDVQTRYERAFRFIRLSQDDTDNDGQLEDITTPGPVAYADFLYDTIPLQAKQAQLEIDGGDEAGTDQVTFSFGGDADNANEIANFFTSNAEWSALRSTTINGGTGVVGDRARSVFNNVTNVTIDVDYRGLESEFYGGRYFQIFAPGGDSETIEDLAGNLVAPDYDILEDGTLIVRN